jgi:hypothetical protein
VTQDQFSLVSEKVFGIPEDNFTKNIELDDDDDDAHAEFYLLMISDFKVLELCFSDFVLIWGQSPSGLANTRRWLPVLMCCSTLCVG